MTQAALPHLSRGGSIITTKHSFSVQPDAYWAFVNNIGMTLHNGGHGL